MDALKRHRLSRRGYRSHLTRIIAATKDNIERDPSELTESDYTSLVDWQKQLDRKKEILTDIDAKIIGLIEEEGELESEVLETEEIQETISQQAAQVDRVLRLYRHTHPDPSTVVTRVTPPQVPTSDENNEESTASSETVSIPATDDTHHTQVIPHDTETQTLPVTVTHPENHVSTLPESHATHPVIPTNAVTSESHVAPLPASHLSSSSGATTVYLSSVFPFSQVNHYSGSPSGTVSRQPYTITHL